MGKSETRKAGANKHQEWSKEPGFLVRRLNQIAISLFLERMSGLAITPLQFTVMQIVSQNPGLPQRAIAIRALLDTSTTADIVARLAEKGLLTRQQDNEDRRSRTVELTTSGLEVLKASEPVMHSTQDELVACLSPKERTEFVRILSRLVDAHVDRQEKATPGPWSRYIRRPRGDL